MFARGSPALASLAVFVAGCATLVSGTTQRVPVSSTPPGVTVHIEPGGMTLVTPGEVVLLRKAGPYRLRFERDGYRPVEMHLSRTDNGWVWGNIVLTGLVGAAVDWATGAAYVLRPEAVHADLVLTGPSSRLDSPAILLGPDGAVRLAIQPRD